MVDQYITLDLVAKMYGLPVSSLRNKARAGTLPGAAKCGKLWRVHLATLKAAWAPRGSSPPSCQEGGAGG